VRLAFAVAVHVDPEVLLVDEALAVGDIGFRQRCMRKVQELRAAGVTILLVSHSLADVKAVGDRALWLDRGEVAHIGAPEAVLARYQAAVTAKDSRYRQRTAPAGPEAGVAKRAELSGIVETIPNIDRRYGDARAEVLGIEVLHEDGHRLHVLEPSSRVRVRISVRAREPVPSPIVGFMMRNHLGIDFWGTNTARESCGLPPMQPGDILTVNFSCDLPELYPASFSFSPAISDGTLLHSTVCDWIDNAIALEVERTPREVYGYIHVPCRVEVNARLHGATAGEAASAAENSRV